VGVERLLRLHCLQEWFNLSNPVVEEALYDARAMRQFVGIDLGREPVPDETMISKFRQLLKPIKTIKTLSCHRRPGRLLAWINPSRISSSKRKLIRRSLR
jgi:hypothetical protein